MLKRLIIRSNECAMAMAMALVTGLVACGATGEQIPASKVHASSATTVLWTLSTNEVNKPASAVEGRTTRAPVDWNKDYKLSIVVDNIGGLKQLHAKTTFVAHCATQPLNDSDVDPPAWPGTYTGEVEVFDGPPPPKAEIYRQDLIHSVSIPTFSHKDKCPAFTDATGTSRTAVVTDAEYSVALAIIKPDEASESSTLTLELKP